MKEWCAENGSSDFRSSITISYLQSGTFNQTVLDILLLEDRKFFEHRGFEIQAIPRGLRRLFVYKKFGGISTVDQLLVRTYLNRRERTVRRKSKEILLATLLNFHVEKADILLAFINSAYFGFGLNGADAAANLIFKRPAVYLTEEQSAFVASLLPYPLPRSIYYLLRGTEIIMEPNEIFSHAIVTNPWWTQRIKGRIEYLKTLRAKNLEVF